MHDCDYCGAQFEDEKPLLEHLRDEHGDELGPIDRKRVSQLGGGGSGLPQGATVFVLAGLALVGLAAVYTLFFSGGGGGGSAVEAQSLSQQGNSALLQDVQTFDSGGRNHVSQGTDVQYDTLPPVSGDHWGATRRPGFYEEVQPYEALVHNLEHGHVVVYYDPAALTDEAEAKLKAYANRYTSNWASVLVVPNPKDDPEAAYVMTAWRHKMTMDSFDEDKLVAFLSEYLGRGPENPVR